MQELIWFVGIFAASGLLGLWFLLAQGPVAKRLAITTLVMTIAAFLLYGHNKMWVGHQGLKAELNYREGKAELEFKDVAGRSQPISERPAIKEEVFARLSRKLDNGKPRTSIDSLDKIQTAGENTLVIDFGGTMPAQRDLANWLVEGTYKLRNPDKNIFHINTGIDLRGGVEFTCRLFKNGEVVAADDDVISILQRRLDARGLTEPQVFRLTSGDVQIVIPGGTEADAARTRGVLETTGRLEVREVLYFLDERDVKQTKDGNWTFGSGYPNAKRNPFADVVYEEVVKPGEAPRWAHLGPVEWEGRHVTDASPSFDSNGQLAVSITLGPEGGGLNRQLTERAHKQKTIKRNAVTGRDGSGHIAITLDGMIESAPVVIEPSGKTTQITGNFTQDEVDQLRTVLKAGSLSVTPRVISERVVGPSLGKETIEKGTSAMLGALLLVLVSMVVYYQPRLGSVAVVSLVVTVGLIFIVLSVFDATLTLPGMAGLVLTVGMAVDANILIFERLREEMTEDVDVATGIENGYSRAFVTIIDANLTTFLTALILYIFGAGPVKGFGMTLMIGIGTSMFAALYVGRMLTDWLYGKLPEVKVPTLIKVPELKYSSYRFGALILSVVVATTSWIWFVTGANEIDDRFGNDFTGGYQLQVNFNESFSNKDLVEQLASAHESMGEEGDLLDPKSLQLLPYFAGFDATSEGSNQWMIKGRDTEGAAEERKRAALEDELSSNSRELERQRNLPPADKDPVAIDQLKKAVADLDKQVSDISEGLAERQGEFKKQLSKAMAAFLEKEGQELHAASFAGKTLSLTLGTIAEADADSLAGVKEELELKDHIASVDLAARTEGDQALVDVSVELVLAPAPIQDYEIAGPVVERLAGLLAVDEEKAEDLGRFKIADDLFKDVSKVMADRGVAIDKPFPSSQHFSPLVGDQMKAASLIAMALAIIVILSYVAARFEFRYGVGAIIALVHDVVITIGLLAIFNIQIDLTVVAALLTIIGYSLNDTMVVFDRIRENIRSMEASLDDIVDRSIAQTMSRTLLTSFTTIAVVVILVLFGGEGLAPFAGTLLIGLVLGTYSSVFVAAPVLVMLNKGRPASALLAQATVDDDDDEEYGVERLDATEGMELSYDAEAGDTAADADKPEKT